MLRRSETPPPLAGGSKKETHVTDNRGPYSSCWASPRAPMVHRSKYAQNKALPGSPPRPPFTDCCRASLGGVMWSWKYPDVSHKKPGVGAAPPLVLSRPPWACQAAMGFARIRVAKPLLVSPGPGVPGGPFGVFAKAIRATPGDSVRGGLGCQARSARLGSASSPVWKIRSGDAARRGRQRALIICSALPSPRIVQSHDGEIVCNVRM